MKRLSNRFLAISILLSSFCISVFGAKIETIRLTGTLKEKAEMTIGFNGRKEVISALPYQFKIPKDELPVTLTFRSPNYVYYDITIPKKAGDSGHVYLMKVDENATSLMLTSEDSGNRRNKSKKQDDNDDNAEVEGIDTNYGVNAAPVTGEKKENTVAVIISNEDYEMVDKVPLAINDGLAFREYCVKTLGLPMQNIKYYPNASLGKMRKAVNDIKSLAEAYKGELSLLIYYSGHGIPDNDSKDAFLLPVDADGSDMSVCMSMRKLYEDLGNMNVEQCVVFLDACFSGAKRDGEMIVSARGVAIKPRETQVSGKTVVFSATSDAEAAYAYPDQEHGLFSYYLLKKLQETKGKVKLGELADYLKKVVPIQSLKINNKKQTPTVAVSPGIEDTWQKLKIVGED